jgi:hypothetical protein
MPTRNHLQAIADAFWRAESDFGPLNVFVSETEPVCPERYEMLTLDEWLVHVDVWIRRPLISKLCGLLRFPVVRRWRTRPGDPPEYQAVVVGRDAEGRWAGFRCTCTEPD